MSFKSNTKFGVIARVCVCMSYSFVKNIHLCAVNYGGRVRMCKPDRLSRPSFHVHFHLVIRLNVVNKSCSGK